MILPSCRIVLASSVCANASHSVPFQENCIQAVLFGYLSYKKWNDPSMGQCGGSLLICCIYFACKSLFLLDHAAVQCKQIDDWARLPGGIAWLVGKST